MLSDQSSPCISIESVLLLFLLFTLDSLTGYLSYSEYVMSSVWQLLVTAVKNIIIDGMNAVYIASLNMLWHDMNPAC